MTYRPRKLKLSAEADAVFASTELEARQRILQAVSEFFERAMPHGQTCVQIEDCEIGVSCHPEIVVVKWIQLNEARRPRKESERRAA